jgi:hypothetical protein
LAVVATLRLSVLDAAATPFKVAREKAPVTPEGKPLTDKASVEANPFWGVVEIVTCDVFPTVAVSEAALAETVNVGVGTTIESARLALAVPAVAFTITG